MIKMTIERADKSIYWENPFNSLEDAKKWLEEEQTRPYWDETFNVILERIGPPPPTPEELAARQAKQDAAAMRSKRRQGKILELRTKSKTQALSMPEMSELLLALCAEWAESRGIE